MADAATDVAVRLPSGSEVADIQAGDVGVSQAILFHASDFDAGRFAELWAETGVAARRVGELAAVDVGRPQIFLMPARALRASRGSDAVAHLLNGLSVIIVVGRPEDHHRLMPDDVQDAIFAWLDEPIGEGELRFALRSALRQLELLRQNRQIQQDLDRRTEEMAALHHVGIALSSEQDMDALQELVLTKARELTVADAGSLYLVVEEDQPALDPAEQPMMDAEGMPIFRRVKMLAFNKAQNFSNPSDFKAFKMPLGTGIAGFVATTGAVVQHDDIYELPEGLPYSFNQEFDRQTGYRTVSMLTVPMVDSKKKTIGVIQLINRKRKPETKLTLANVKDEVLPFSDENCELALSFASQAAVALDNKRLMDSIQALFEGFVTASVQAIESRDPTTSGHSGRVAIMTVGLAEVVNSVGTGRFKETRYTDEALKAIRYAALLHDFGKVGVREHVLVKAKKLYDWQIQQIRGRFDLARAALESRYLRRKLDYLLTHGAVNCQAALTAIDEAFLAETEQLQDYFQLIKQVNEPTVLEDNGFAQLETISSLTYEVMDTGAAEPLVEQAELKKLSIRKGSLDDAERLEIESHVTHTYKFLTKIPWTTELQYVPEVAWAHHEKLDGSGYPNGLTSDQIPLQSKMMTIADIYDALTALDRPYKRAVPVDKALQILEWEVKDGHIDADLFDLFVQQRVYRLPASEESRVKI